VSRRKQKAAFVKRLPWVRTMNFEMYTCIN
jgi:hypothetical protein